MRKVTCLILLVFIVYACKDEAKTNQYQTIDFKPFSIKVPSNWTPIEMKGIDSRVAGILTEINDTIIFDYGKDTPDNSNVISVSDLRDKKKLDSLDFPVDEMFFSKLPDIDMNQGTFHKEFYYYELIDNRKTKVKVPKRIGDGVTSVFFDSLENKNNL